MLESLEPRRLLASLVIVESDDTTSVGESEISADTFTVALDEPPVLPVVVSVVSADPTQVDVDIPQIEFDASNWDQPQTVTVEGVSDEIDEPDQNVEIIVSVVDELSDDEFDSALDQLIDVAIVDDDVAGIAIFDVDGAIELTEDGISEEFSVALTSEPTSEVRVQLEIDAQQVKISSPGSIYSIGNSLSWNARLPVLDGNVEYHNDCGVNLQFIFDNPDSPCTDTSRLWTDALINQPYDWVVVQPFFGTTITQDATAISHWMSLQPNAVFVIHTGWSGHENREADYNGGNPNDEMVHSPEYFDDLIVRLLGMQGNQDRVIVSTHAMDILDSFYTDFEDGISPFDDVTAEFYVDHIHMTPLGQYFAHSALRQALGQPLSNLHFRFLSPEVIEYMNTNIEQYSTGAVFDSVEIVFDSTNWSTPQSITVAPTDNAELGSNISLSVVETTVDTNYVNLASSSLPVNILALNDRPSFEISGDVLVDEDSGPNTIADLFAAIDVGPGEDDQSVIAYHVSNLSDETLFETVPSFDESGNLIFTPQVDASGSATLEVSIQDDGGTENGTTDTSLTQLLSITITPVNDPPSFTMTDPPAVPENSGPQIIDDFVSEIVFGPDDESTQSLVTVSVANIDHPGLFATLPTIDLSGKLQYTPAADQFGTSTFSVTIQDDGGTDAGGIDVSDSQTFTIDIKESHSLVWQNPADISFGTLLDSTQLNATSNIAGEFVYLPAAGELLSAGESHELSVTFDPDDPFYESVSTSVFLNVVKATPDLQWSNPEGIIVGTPLDSTQLNATADVEGTFAYDPPLGSILGVGEDQLLTATFTPADASNFDTGKVTVEIDVAKAGPSIVGPTRVTSLDPFDVGIDFGETVNGFTQPDINVVGGNVAAMVIEGEGVFTATIVPNEDGLLTIDVPAGVATDAEGVPNNAAIQHEVLVTPIPTPVITGPSSPISLNPFDVSIDFGESVSGFYLNEIDVTGGTAIDAVIHGGGLYTATIAPSGDGAVIVDVAAGVANDDDGNASHAAASYSVDGDMIAPTPVITGPAGPTSLDLFDVTIDFGETVNGFYLSEIDVTGGTAVNALVHGNGLFTATIVPSGDGTVTVDLDAGVAVDAVGNASESASQFSVVFNHLAPTPVISGPTSPTSSAPLDVTIDFGETVTGFRLSEIDVTGGIAINAVIHGNGLFTATIAPSGPGTVTVDIAAEVAVDRGGNANNAATQYSVVVEPPSGSRLWRQETFASAVDQVLAGDSLFDGV